MAAFQNGVVHLKGQESPFQALHVSFPWEQIELRAEREVRGGENSLEQLILFISFDTESWVKRSGGNSLCLRCTFMYRHCPGVSLMV